MKRYILTLLLFIGSLSVSLAQNEVSGTITDFESNPLPGVTVVVKGTQHGVASDANGRYSISVADKDVLEIGRAHV